jgi:hypothetical protein
MRVGAAWLPSNFCNWELCCLPSASSLPHKTITPTRRRATTAEPLRIDAGDRPLVVELVDGALLVEEEQHLPRSVRESLWGKRVNPAVPRRPAGDWLAA